MIKFVGFGILTAFASVVLSELGFKGKRLFSVIGCVLLFSVLADGVGEILRQTGAFYDVAGISEAAATAVKIIGAGYLFGTSAELISELGEPLVSKGLLAAGKIEILLIVLPYFVDIMELGLELIE